METGLLHLPVRQPTDEGVLKWLIISLTSDDPLDPQVLNDNNLIGVLSTHTRFLSCPNSFTAMKGWIGRHFCVQSRKPIFVETQRKELILAEVEQMCAYLRQCPPEVVQKTFQKTT